jgi:hypothetical protein
MYEDANTNLVLSAGVQNAYGLSINSIHFLSFYGTYLTLTPTSPIVASNYYGYYESAEDFFVGTPDPTLQTVDYYFASETPFFNYQNLLYSFGTTTPPPLPGSPTFSVTNTSPLLITGLGQEITVSGWAQEAITNGSGGTCAYLEQYFTNALTIGTNGLPTTNSAGLLSPYGEFFPTTPGPAALLTMPDIDTGKQGTGVVYVIKLQLDVNHDGTMDLSFAGPDNTSQANPFTFWINNDRDVPGSSGAFSNPLDHDIEAFPNQPSSQDWYQGYITCKRGLEDFARLWVCGVPSLPANQGYTITLSCNAISKSPTINLYLAETNGGTLYLTSTNVAQTLVGETKLATVSPTNTYVFPANFFDGSNKYFLFEGAGIGEGQFVLTIQNGSNILAQTSAWLDLHDIKDLYEQAHVTNVQTNWPEMVQQPTTSSFELDYTPPQNTAIEKQIIVFVHGWRLTHWAYYTFAETMFKRLYWQGFQGRFAAPYWPTSSADQVGNIVDFLTFNMSEHIALDSGTGIARYLTDLKTRFPDYTISVCSHSQGATIMAEALKQLAASNQQPIQNYVIMQGALSAQCYDSGFTNYPLFDLIEQVVPTPNSYFNYAQNITNAIQGKLVNYFNTNDFGLQLWNANNYYLVQQTNGYFTMKPASMFGYQTDGTDSWLTNSLVGIDRSVTNLYELMPFVARARSLAVGEQAGVHGTIQGGEIDLQAQFGFTGEWYDHSGEFNRAIQEPEGHLFYVQLLNSLFTSQP